MSPLLDLDALAQLVSPTGEGTVILSMHMFQRLLAELRECRAQLQETALNPPEHETVRLTPKDRERLLAIRVLAGTDDSRTLARQLHDYYRDADRADRTPRPVLYLHIGLLAGACLDATAAPSPSTTPN